MFFNKYITVACLVATLFVTNVSEAYVCNDASEHIYGNLINDEYANSVRSWDNNFISNIQAELVQYNSNKLNFDDGRHSRYLSPVKESSVPAVDAVTIPAGQIYVSTQMIDFTMTVSPDGKIDLRNQGVHNEENIYQRSMLASVIAHESSHWYNRDFQRKLDSFYGENGLQKLLGNNWATPTKENLELLMKDIAYNKTSQNANFSVEGEYLADKQAVEFLNNTMKFSSGSLVSFLYRLKNHDNQYALPASASRINMTEYNPHPDIDARINRLEKQISDYSYGRVTFNNQKFYLDGKPFMGTGVVQGTNKVSTLDRTYYVAGQIANIIHKGCFGTGKIAFYNVYNSDDIHDANITDVYLICADKEKNVLHIIDRLKLNPNESQYLLGDKERPSGYEYSYDAKLAKYIATYE